jgi:hypothetical protein
MIEVHFAGNKAVEIGDQFGIGRAPLNHQVAAND